MNRATSTGQRRTLSLEILEPRMLLAGNVTAAVRHDNLMIKGDRAGNCVEISQSDQAIRVAGCNNTTINRRAAAFTSTSVRGDLKIQLKGGNDSLTLTGVSAPRNLTVIDSAGNDDVCLIDSTVAANTTVNTGKGTDTLGAVATNNFATAPVLAGIETVLPNVCLRSIGNPNWRPVDFHVFSAVIGTSDTGFQEFFQTTESLLPPPNHRAHPSLGVGPGDPHAGPYDDELGQGVADRGFTDKLVFDAAEFSGGNGVYFVYMNVPAPGTTGSSPDFAAGPIIPNSRFPIHFDGDMLRNGALFDAAFDSDLPPLDSSLDPPFNVDGPSHFPSFFADSIEFGPPGTAAAGNYQYHVTMTDTTGSGWFIRAPFQVRE